MSTSLLLEHDRRFVCPSGRPCASGPSPGGGGRGSPPRGLDREEVACPDPLCLSTQELAPARAIPAGCGLEPRGPKDLLHRGRSHAHPELSALPLDPHIAPSRVLPCHTADERRDCRVDWRTAEAILLVRPFPPHEFSVPTHQGGGRHDEGSPPMPRQHA